MARRFTRRRRRTRRRTRFRTRRRRRPRIGKTLFGNKRTVKLRYNTSFSVELPALGVVDDRIILANGITTPELVGGHAPRGFNQLMALYDHYTVIGSKCTAMWSVDGANLNRPTVNCNITLRDNTTPLTVFEDIMEDRNTKFRTMNPSGNSVMVRKGYSLKRFFSVVNALDRDNMRGTVNLNPAEQASYHITSRNADLEDTTTPTTYINVMIDYIVIFHEPFQPSISVVP